MDADIARHLARTAFRIGRELEDALALLQRQCSEEEYRMCAREIAAALHAVNTAVLDRALASMPTLRAEIDASIGQYGRYV